MLTTLQVHFGEFWVAYPRHLPHDCTRLFTGYPNCAVPRYAAHFQYRSGMAHFNSNSNISLDNSNYKCKLALCISERKEEIEVNTSVGFASAKGECEKIFALPEIDNCLLSWECLLVRGCLEKGKGKGREGMGRRLAAAARSGNLTLSFSLALTTKWLLCPGKEAAGCLGWVLADKTECPCSYGA